MIKKDFQYLGGTDLAQKEGKSLSFADILMQFLLPQNAGADWVYEELLSSGTTLH
jgi:hypothetical protein